MSPCVQATTIGRNAPASARTAACLWRPRCTPGCALPVAFGHSRRLVWPQRRQSLNSSPTVRRRLCASLSVCHCSRTRICNWPNRKWPKSSLQRTRYGSLVISIELSLKHPNLLCFHVLRLSLPRNPPSIFPTGRPLLLALHLDDQLRLRAGTTSNHFA